MDIDDRVHLRTLDRILIDHAAAVKKRALSCCNTTLSTLESVKEADALYDELVDLFSQEKVGPVLVALEEAVMIHGEKEVKGGCK